MEGAGGHSSLPLHEFVVNSRLLKKHLSHKAVLLVRTGLYILFLGCVRLRTVTCATLDGLVIAALACELWLGVSIHFSILAKWFLVERETHPDRLLDMIRSGHLPQLPPVDVFVTTADPAKEPPLITVNTVLSVLALDYPAGKLACYVSDDGGSLLTLWALKEAATFARSWVPFCKRLRIIEPRAPGPYFARKATVADAQLRGFSKEWHAMKAEYDALESRLSFITSKYCDSKEEALKLLRGKLSTSSDSIHDRYPYWDSKYDSANHPSYCEILVEKPESEADFLPCVVYISREKLSGRKHHYKAGAMNALIRVSGVFTNAPFILNLDCDMYVNDTKALLRAMCFFMDPSTDRETGFVQFPQCFEGVDEDDIYGNRMTTALEIFMKGMDGLQGPPYCGTGCVHKREALYGNKPHAVDVGSGQVMLNGQETKLLGRCRSLVLCAQSITSNMSNSNSPLLKRDSFIEEAMKLIDCTYEDDTSWGKQIGLIYGSTVEDLMTGLIIHSRGWRSVSCIPSPPAFLGCAPTTSEDALTTRKRWSMGMLEILFSSNSPFLVNNTQGLALVQRMIYMYIFLLMPLTCFPLLTYGLLPAFSLLAERPFLPQVDDPALVIPISLFVWLYWNNYYENMLVGVGPREWWNSERMEYIVAVSSNAFATFEVLKKIIGLSDTTFVVTPKSVNKSNISVEERSAPDEQQQPQQGFVVNSNSPLFIPPTVLVLLNAAGLVAAIARICVNLLGGYNRTVAVLPVEAVCAVWVLFVLQPFVRGLSLWCQGGQGPLALRSSTVLRSSLLALTFIVFSLRYQTR